MSLPGIRTLLRDRFAALGRTNDLLGSRIALLARRGNTATTTYPDYVPYRALDEKNIITGFSEDSEIHRGYLELIAAGANNVYVIPLPLASTDSGTGSGSLYYELETNGYPSAETIEPEIMVPFGRGSKDPAVAATPDSTGIGAVGDNTATASANFAVQLAKWCAKITLRSSPVLGVIGLQPFNDGTLVPTAAQLATWLADDNTLPSFAANGAFYVDSVGDNVASDYVEAGRYISIVAAEVKHSLQADSGKDWWGFGNGACTYAGLISTLPAVSAPTNKTLFNVTNLRWVPTRSQQETLTNKELVPFALDFTRTPIVVDAPTYAPTASDYGRLTTMRIVLDAVQLVRLVSKKFVGEAATLERRNSLETAIRSALQGMTTAGALLQYHFLITYFGNTNSATVDLILRPAFEMREIKIQVQIEV